MVVAEWEDVKEKIHQEGQVSLVHLGLFWIVDLLVFMRLVLLASALIVL